VRHALAIDASSTIEDRTIDITTVHQAWDDCHSSRVAQDRRTQHGLDGIEPRPRQAPESYAVVLGTPVPDL
jgi:hypothetical protein